MWFLNDRYLAFDGSLDALTALQGQKHDDACRDAPPPSPSSPLSSPLSSSSAMNLDLQFSTWSELVTILFIATFTAALADAWQMDDGQGRLGPVTKAPGQGPGQGLRSDTASDYATTHNNNNNYNHDQPSVIAKHYTWRVPPSHSLQLHAFVATLEQRAKTRASFGASTETGARPVSSAEVGVVDTVWSVSSPNIYDALSHMYAPIAIAVPTGGSAGTAGDAAAAGDNGIASGLGDNGDSASGAAPAVTLLSPISSYASTTLHPVMEEEEEKKDHEPPFPSSSSLPLETSTTVLLHTTNNPSNPTPPTSPNPTSSVSRAPLSLALATLRSSLSQSYRISQMLLQYCQPPLCRTVLSYVYIHCDAFVLGLHQSYHILHMRLIEVITRLGAFLLTQVVLPFLVVLAVVIGCRDVSYPKVGTRCEGVR